MKVIYKLKEWYSLQEAAARFTEVFSEEITLQHILEFASDGVIDLYWELGHQAAIKCEYIPINKVVDGKKITVNALRRNETSKTVTYLEGRYRFPLIVNRDLPQFYRELIKFYDELNSFDGFELDRIPFDDLAVEDDKKQPWSLMQVLSEQQIKEKNLSSDVAWNDIRRYSSRYDWPKVSQLGIPKLEIERFETENFKQLGDTFSTKERNTLLKLVIGMAVEQYDYNPASARNQATAHIATDLETNGVPLDRDTILKWLREASELLPNEPD